jgi:hypothetical protein
MEKAKPFSLWEIPFILMDTTLATTYRFSSGEALGALLPMENFPPGMATIAKGMRLINNPTRQTRLAG